MLGVVLVVVIRSVLPEGVVGEESLRVRGGYLRGALHVLQNNPLGVGVDGFQDAYLGVRRAGDAEEVRSAHALLADWLVILGVFALPWMWALARTTFSFRAGDCVPASGFLAGLSAALASALALQVELSSVAGTSALLRVVGVLGAGGVAWCLATGTASVGRGVLAASLAMLVHAQLDVTSVTPNAVVWCGLLLAMAAPSIPEQPVDGCAARRPRGGVCPRGKPDHPCGSRFVDAGSGHCHSTASPVGPGIAPLALRPAAASGSGAFGIGFTGGSSLKSSRPAVEVELGGRPTWIARSVAGAQPLRPSGTLTVRPKPDGKRGTTKGHENFGNGVWRWTMPFGIRPESCRPASVLKLKSVLAASLRPRARVPRPRSRGTKWRQPPTACP